MLKEEGTILVTGSAGFIGSALVQKLLKHGMKVIGLDNINNYYDIELKKARIKEIEKTSNIYSGSWKFYKADLEDISSLKNIFKAESPRIVVNLAAQAGVRYSLINPSSYIQSNMVGFGNLLEECRKSQIEHLVFASSSSVYGGNINLPFQETHEVNHPVSLYAATKKSNELMAHAYSHIYKLPTTGLRFFTVYGPWGRPDMAPMIFTKAILSGNPIKVNNFGKMKRDFTYIDDIVEGTFRCCFKPATENNTFDSSKPDSSSSNAPYRIFNIGNSTPIELIKFIEVLEDKIGCKAIMSLKPLPLGDVVGTFSDNSLLNKWIGYSPSTSIEKGLTCFIDWYKSYYAI